MNKPGASVICYFIGYYDSSQCKKIDTKNRHVIKLRDLVTGSRTLTNPLRSKAKKAKRRAHQSSVCQT